MWIVKALPFSSTASCTRCATTGSARSTQSKVGGCGIGCEVGGCGFYDCAWIHLFAGKPSGYDRVRNAEIGNKVSGWNIEQ